MIFTSRNGNILARFNFIEVSNLMRKDKLGEVFMYFLQGREAVALYWLGEAVVEITFAKRDESRIISCVTMLHSQ